MTSFAAVQNSHILVVAGRHILLISRYVDDGALFNRDILIIRRIARPDFGTLGIQRNSHRSTKLLLFSFPGIVYDGLMVLVGAMGEVHAHDVCAGST